MNRVSIIIVSFNTCALLRACLASLRTCTLPLRIIVVDNASHDGSAATVRAEFPEAELLEPGQNLGFAGANNLALRAVLSDEFLVLSGDSLNPELNTQNSKLKYVLLLNPDTVVHAGAIEAMVAFLDLHPRVGMVGPRLLNSDGSLQSAAFRFPTLSMTALDLFPPGEVLPGRLHNSWWHGRYPQERAGNGPFPIDHPLGACMLVRCDVITQVGVFDEAFFMYAEEVDWCFRVRAAGWAIWQVPVAQVTHVGGAATSQVRAKMLIALYASRMRFFRKHYQPGFVRWNRLIVRLGMLRATTRAWREYARGTLPRAALREQLWAFGRVFQQ